jgi:ABC-type dipeptide/oligopeptide/nickel transport system permease component
MLRSLFRRLALIPLALLIANFVGYAFAFTGSPIIASSNPYSQGATDLPPLFPAYWEYFQGMFRGDFGETFNGEPVIESIQRFGVASLGLLGISLLLSILFGILLGRIAVRRNRAGVAAWLTFSSTIGLALPSFYIAILLITLFLLFFLYGTSARLPPIPFQGFGWDAHLILPVLALTFQPTVKIAQVTGSLLSEEMEKQYVTAAMSFGHSFRRIKNRFAFRSIAAPILLTIAASLRIMIAELIIIERLFNWPGIGRLIGAALSIGAQSDYLLEPSLIAALLTVLVGIFLLTDLTATFLSRIVDPRLRVDTEPEQKGM